MSENAPANPRVRAFLDELAEQIVAQVLQEERVQQGEEEVAAQAAPNKRRPAGWRAKERADADQKELEVYSPDLPSASPAPTRLAREYRA